jgi:NADH-quinone oxidoreductase subunit G
MAEIEIDGQTYQVDAGDNLLKVCLSLKLDLPYFCWHPAMGSVGACRQCAVLQFKNHDDQRGRIVMACMTLVTGGLRVSLERPEARDFRADIIELLMINHPHDCPVCEEGGECHLQDMTEMTGHTFRRYRGRKRTHHNQYLGPFINHEMNRCIACYRCVRFYQDYAGGRDLDVFGAHDHVYFGRHEDGVLENEFSGNLVEVCPTGVFTDKTFSAHYTRKWDLQSAPSVCAHCSLGCNTTPGERYGTLRRIVNRYHGDINGYFLCDRGRFGYAFVNSSTRLRKPLILGQQAIGGQVARERFAAILKGSDNVIGIGSPRASLEANFALRELVGQERFHMGFADREGALIQRILDIVQGAPVRMPSLRDVEEADAVLILGEDIDNTAPRLALALRQAVRNKAFEIADRLKISRWQDAAVREAAQDEKSPLFIASPTATRLDDIAAGAYRAAPEEIARLGFAVAHRLNAESPAVDALSAEADELSAAIAQALREAKHPLVITGVGIGSETVIEATANIAFALTRLRGAAADLCFVVPECNSLGLGLMGGGNLESAFQAVHEGAADTVVILENDLYRRAARDRVDRFLAEAKRVVVIDHTFHDTAKKAGLVLPGSTFAETEGTLVGSEGRAQRFFSVFPPDGDVQDSWRWLLDAMQVRWRHLDYITEACASALPVFKPILRAAPSANFRIEGMKIPRQPHRYSGRTAITANIRVSEPKQPVDEDSPLSFSMEGAPSGYPPSLNPGAWAPGWNSNQSVFKFQDEPSGHLRGGDPGVRLIEPKVGAEFPWFSRVPTLYGTQNRQWRLVPLYHIFGSEELSMLSPPLAERAPSPYLALNPDDAEELELASGDWAELELSGVPVRLPVLWKAELANGLIGVPTGLPGIPWFAPLAETDSIRKVEA